MLEIQKRELSPDELSNMPVHMRPPSGTVVTDRRRTDVRLRVTIDDQLVSERTLPPGGLWGDKNSVALETFEVSPGSHRVEIAISDSSQPEEWTFTAEDTIEFAGGKRRVVLFDREEGFSWH